MPVPREVLEELIHSNKTLHSMPTDFDRLGRAYHGKVRDNYTRDRERIIVVSDRVSAFDRVLGTIPLKGQILNCLAKYWFDQSNALFANHVLNVPDPQVMRAIECKPIPIEMVVRGFLTGVTSTSIWQAYERGDRQFCGHKLAQGLRKHEKLEKNIVTPSTKAPQGGHDSSVSKDELFAMNLIEPDLFEELEAKCLALFAFGQELAAQRGLVLVDTKYELGLASNGQILLIDEIHTPDSSRYWYAESYESALSKGEDPKSLDKEFLRRWLKTQGYGGDGPVPYLPLEIRAEAAIRYIETYELIVGAEFVPNLEDPAARIRKNLNI